MITLAAGGTLAGKAGTGAVINYTVMVDLITTAEAFAPTQGQLAVAAGTIYTSTGGMSLVKVVMMANTSGSDVAGCQLFVGGTGAANAITGTFTIPANGTACYANGVLNVYNSAGAVSSTSTVVFTAKGSLIASTGVNAAAELPAGANGKWLSPDSTATSGMKWAFGYGGAPSGFVNILDFGGDSSGATDCSTALTNAVAALTNGGGTVYFPPGTYLFTAAVTVSANNIRILGGGPNVSTIKGSSATADLFTLSGYGSGIEMIQIQGPGAGTTSAKSAGYGINLTGTESYLRNCDTAYHWNAVGCNGPLTEIDGLACRYFANSGIVVNQNSDHRIARVMMDNAAATLPATAGIDVQVTASLLLDTCNIIHSNWALNLSPGAGVTIPSVKGLNCFFDTSAIGLRMAGAGSVFRTEFTNCWFSTMTTAGILMAPTTAGANVDGITFVNCDIYGATPIAAGSVGVSVTTANVGKWKMVGCSIAGWATGISIVAGASHYPTILSNTIGAVSAFLANTTGIVIGAGAYKGLVMQGNDCNDNTTVLTLGAATFTANGNFRITDNPGINPRNNGVATPATPAAAAVVTNTTGFRVVAYVKIGATAPTAVVVGGVTTAAPVANQELSVVLDPGQTISFTTTAPTSWVWSGL